jgi:mannitol operon repressor
MSDDDGRKFVSLSGGYNPDTKDFTDFLEEFNKESDRGAALSSAAYVDDLLADIARAFLIENRSSASLVDEYPGALSSFSSRILIAHAMGLISEDERDECNIIRKVRNEFAHSVRMSFSNAKVEALCTSLKFATIVPTPNARMRFTSSAVTLITRLMKRPNAVKAYQLQVRNWS